MSLYSPPIRPFHLALGKLMGYERNIASDNPILGGKIMRIAQYQAVRGYGASA